MAQPHIPQDILSCEICKVLKSKNYTKAYDIEGNISTFLCTEIYLKFTKVIKQSACMMYFIKHNLVGDS